MDSEGKYQAKSQKHLIMIALSKRALKAAGAKNFIFNGWDCAVLL
jgi:hypothetical protein